MSYKLFDSKMCDGSRRFADLPETFFFDKLREMSRQFKGATETRFITDWVTEVWLDFEFRGHEFSINKQMGDYWFIVNNPACPDEILLEVIEYFHKFSDE